MQINFKTSLVIIGAMGLIVFAAQPLLFPKNTTDEWISSDSQKRQSAYRWLTPQHLYKVQPARVTDAIRELTSIKIKPVTQSEAEEYIGKPVRISKNFKPYLVRGVLFHDETGRFSLERNGNDLLILHSSLGPSTPIQRQPLIIFLDWKPQNIFVQANMAE